MRWKNWALFSFFFFFFFDVVIRTASKEIRRWSRKKMEIFEFRLFVCLFACLLF